MRHLWTIVFFILLAIAFAVAAWHDRQDTKRSQRKSASYGKDSKGEE